MCAETDLMPKFLRKDLARAKICLIDDDLSPAVEQAPGHAPSQALVERAVANKDSWTIDNRLHPNLLVMLHENGMISRMGAGEVMR